MLWFVAISGIIIIFITFITMLTEDTENSEQNDKTYNITDRKLIPLICPRCGGVINSETLECEYCNTKYIKGDK